MTRAYLRLDPGFFERKAIHQGYSLPAIAALIGCFCLAEHQPTRGAFRNERVLKALLGPAAGRYVTVLIERGDLKKRGAELYVDGWEEWQEGDLTVKERMARLRNKKRNRTVNPAVTPNVTDRIAVGGAVAQDKAGTAGRNGGHRYPGLHDGSDPTCVVCQSVSA